MAKLASDLLKMDLGELRQAAIKKAGRRKKLGRSALPVFPISLERQYVRELVGWTERRIKVIDRIIAVNAPSILKLAARQQATNDSVRLDELDFDVAIAKLMDLIRSGLGNSLSDAEIIALVSRISIAVSKQNINQLNKAFRSVIAVDPFKAEPAAAIPTIAARSRAAEAVARAVPAASNIPLPRETSPNRTWRIADPLPPLAPKPNVNAVIAAAKETAKVAESPLAGQMRIFITDNVNLIKTIESRLFERIEIQVYKAARNGISYKELQKDLQKQYGISKFNAERIARDQIGKFNSQLTQTRQTEAGITRYRWRTALDARVRHEHRPREGKIFAWDSPPPDGPPGFAIMCRCYAEAVIDDLLDF